MNHEKIKCISFHKNITVFNIDNNQKCFFEQYIIMISEDHDTEDCSNDAENTEIHI